MEVRSAMPEDRLPAAGRETNEDGVGAARVAGPLVHSVEVTVRYAETDQMGRAHHGVYVVWCELGRTSMMREHGVSYADLEQRGVYLPVTRLDVEYRSPARYEEPVRIDTRIPEVRSRTVRFDYELFGSGDRLLARASTELACIDAEGRMRRLPEDVRAALTAASR